MRLNLHAIAPRRIGVFRALVLGDLMCAVPAWRALKTACPRSELTLIGLPWAREFAQRCRWIDDFIEFPGYPGLPERVPDLSALPGFLQTMQQRRFDLLLQMHGSGRVVNPLLAACGAQHVAGFVERGAYCAEPLLHAPWPTVGHEIERMLCLIDHLDAARCGSTLEFPVCDDDRQAVRDVWPGIDAAGSFVCVHAGAQLPSRRWMPERFALVADGLARLGHRVVLTGTAGEASLVAEVAAAMTQDAVDLAGQTTLWTLGALLERAHLLVCNDTGVSHVAAALGVRSIVVSAGADVARWAPQDARLHQVHWADAPCRPCGHATCPVGHPCARAVTAQQVLQSARTAVTDVVDGGRLPAHG
ncbi:glycosyltransferase family 9 protein [Rhizobacter sp. SG703]|uniref:glycosyltransferase family 9 protein n=1 Tax=Rhizobacter sp. SG703 TaxID=2587140 RepID=UPI001446EA10|nr:glycosyltransferase family 9 protein [Rhizobacter sp. SG703]NKI92511.1 ADP-heptose:LPS heptosyltransferase [Rhizobacter sp. SG703]